MYIGSSTIIFYIFFKYFRYYPEIHGLKGLPAEKFIPGKLKIVHLPKVHVSNIPNAIDFSDQKKLDHMVLSGDLKKNELDQEITESNLLDGVTTYFKKLPNDEDVFIMQNQDLCDHSNNTWHERDLVLVNLSRHSALKLEKSAISKVQKNIICIFKNGKKSIFAPEKSLKLPKILFFQSKNCIFGNFKLFLVQKLIFCHI